MREAGACWVDRPFDDAAQQCGIMRYELLVVHGAGIYMTSFARSTNCKVHDPANIWTVFYIELFFFHGFHCVFSRLFMAQNDRSRKIPQLSATQSRHAGGKRLRWRALWVRPLKKRSKFSTFPSHHVRPGQGVNTRRAGRSVGVRMWPSFDRQGWFGRFFGW